MQEAELQKLRDMASGKDVLEIGSFKGLSAWAMAKTARRLICVDTFAAGGGGQGQEDHLTTLDAFLAATAPFKNVSHFVGTSAEAAGNCAVEGQFDLIFIDAMHTYDEVKADIQRWLPRVRGGGVIAFHDYSPLATEPDSWERGLGFPGVKKAVDEKFGVPKNNVGSLVWFVKA